MIIKKLLSYFIFKKAEVQKTKLSVKVRPATPSETIKKITFWKKTCFSSYVCYFFTSHAKIGESQLIFEVEDYIL